MSYVNNNSNSANERRKVKSAILRWDVYRPTTVFSESSKVKSAESIFSGFRGLKVTFPHRRGRWDHRMQGHLSPPVKWPIYQQCTRSWKTDQIPPAVLLFVKTSNRMCCCGCCDPVMWRTVLTLSLIFCGSEGSVTCRDNDNGMVDWWEHTLLLSCFLQTFLWSRSYFSTFISTYDQVYSV